MTVEDLSRGATSVVRGVFDFKEAPAERLAVYIACRSYLHDKVFHRPDGCLGKAIGLQLVGRSHNLVNTPVSQEFFEGVTFELGSAICSEAHMDAQVVEVAPELMDGGDSGSVPAAREDNCPARQMVCNDEGGFPHHQEVVCQQTQRHRWGGSHSCTPSVVDGAPMSGRHCKCVRH